MPWTTLNNISSTRWQISAPHTHTSSSLCIWFWAPDPAEDFMVARGESHIMPLRYTVCGKSSEFDYSALTDWRKPTASLAGMLSCVFFFLSQCNPWKLIYCDGLNKQAWHRPLSVVLFVLWWKTTKTEAERNKRTTRRLDFSMWALITEPEPPWASPTYR